MIIQAFKFFQKNTGELFRTLEKYSRHRRNIQDTEEIFKTLENMKINKRGEGKKEGVVDK